MAEKEIFDLPIQFLQKPVFLTGQGAFAELIMFDENFETHDDGRKISVALILRNNLFDSMNKISKNENNGSPTLVVMDYSENFYWKNTGNFMSVLEYTKTYHKEDTPSSQREQILIDKMTRKDERNQSLQQDLSRVQIEKDNIREEQAKDPLAKKFDFIEKLILKNQFGGENATR